MLSRSSIAAAAILALLVPGVVLAQANSRRADTATGQPPALAVRDQANVSTPIWSPDGLPASSAEREADRVSQPTLRADRGARDARRGQSHPATDAG
jgi:hypothetical protein